MNEEKVLKKLSERAREEHPPEVDVASRVMAKVHARRMQKRELMSPLGWVAVFSAAAAIPVGVAAAITLSTWMHPIMEILGILSGGI